MNPLNPFAVSGLLSIIFLSPSVFFLITQSKLTYAKIYGIYLLLCVLWGAGAFFVAIAPTEMAAIISWKFAYTAVLLIPPVFCHSVYLLTKKKSYCFLVFAYLQALLFIILMFKTNLLMSSVRFMFDSFYYGIATPMYTASFFIFMFIITTAHTELILFIKKCYPKEVGQFKLLILATFIGFLGPFGNFLPPYGIAIYPYGNFTIPISALVTSYAIFRHQAFDINVAIKKSFAYSALILLAALLYFGIILISEKVLQGYWGYKSISVSIMTAFAIGIMFFPLHNQIQKIVDRLIFKRTTEEISKENELLRAEVIKTEKLKSVAILASGMAHEIRNPLTALKTFSEYLPNKLDDKEFLKKFSTIVGSEVDRIDGLVTQLLEFAKPSPVQLQKTNINKLIRETLDFLSNKFIDHKIQIVPELASECDEPILIDPNKIRQVFLNLFLNSIEAMREGGRLEIASRLSDARNDDDKNGRNDEINIIITDTGCGINKENLTHIFDPFFSTKDTGTGLGLPITYGIIKEHGGEIKVISQVGKGTTFTIILPTNKT